MGASSRPLQLPHTGVQELSASRRKIWRLELVEGAFERPAEVARTQPPDLGPDLGVADREARAEPGGKAHRRTPFCHAEGPATGRSSGPGNERGLAAGLGSACFGLRASRLDLFWPLAMAVSCHPDSPVRKARLSCTSSFCATGPTLVRSRCQADQRAGGLIQTVDGASLSLARRPGARHRAVRARTGGRREACCGASNLYALGRSRAAQRLTFPAYRPSDLTSAPLRPHLPCA